MTNKVMSELIGGDTQPVITSSPLAETNLRRCCCPIAKKSAARRHLDPHEKR